MSSTEMNKENEVTSGGDENVQEAKIEEKLDSIKLEEKNDENSENVPKKSKKKKKPKKDAENNVEDESDRTKVKETAVLGEVSNNQVEGSSDPTCNYCSKPNPTKRCVKRHPKCLQKLFCNETCETLAHKKSSAVDNNKAVVGAKAGGKKVDTKKKKGKKGEKPTGEFWWNNSVYASW
eukprot:TRINITY_DN6604_c0_g2_i8.p1 TRINITY_DN6604_c0_g2~~TRINITY_DN6604_c0_g2_i8.p1  ORF type:complete len:191 (-),score=59.95 TRINITY_DN6604_c0_g2_i8:302-835(-)